MQDLCGSIQHSTVNRVMFAKQRPNSFSKSHVCTESKKNEKDVKAGSLLHSFRHISLAKKKSSNADC